MRTGWVQGFRSNFNDVKCVLFYGYVCCPSYWLHHLSNQPTYLSPSSFLPPAHSSIHSPLTHLPTPFTHLPTHSPNPSTHPRIPYFPALCWDQKLLSVGIQRGTQDLGLGLGAPDVVGGRARNISGVKCVGCAETHGDHPKLLGEEKQEGPGE